MPTKEPASDPQQGEPDPLTQGIERISKLATALSAVVGAFLQWKGNTKLVPLIAYSLAVLFLLASFVLQRRRTARERLTKPHKPEPSRSDSRSALLRASLPLDKGDTLIGRDVELIDLQTMIRASSFRFGAVWGQPGSGKTSLLRAGLVPKLESDEMHVIYLERPTSDPISAICGNLSLPSSSESGVSVRPGQAVRSSLKHTSKTTLIIIDQFEEYLALHRTRDSLATVRTFLKDLLDTPGSPRIAVLLAIRDDKFSILQHLAPEIPDPTTLNSSLELYGLTEEAARDVLVCSRSMDGTQFENALIVEVANDLAIDGFVRPVELQLVGTHLKRKAIATLSQYETLGRASGILRSYIKEELRLSGDEHIARILLRRMCAPSGQARGATDVTLGDCVKSVEGYGVKASAESVQRYLEHLCAARIVMRTDEGCFNLVNDYLASLVWSATQGQESAADRATRVLHRYGEQLQIDSSTLIPADDLWLIQWHAARKLRRTSPYRRLVRKSWQRLLLLQLLSPTLFLVLALAVVYIMFLVRRAYVALDHSWDGQRVVLRAGDPGLSLLPGFGHILADSDLRLEDIDSSQADKLWLGSIEVPYSRVHPSPFGWMESLLPLVSPVQRSEVYRLLEAGAAPAALISTLDGRSDPKLALAYGTLPWTSDGQVVSRLVATLPPGLSEVTRSLLVTELRNNGATVKEPLSLRALLKNHPVLLFTYPRPSMDEDKAKWVATTAGLETQPATVLFNSNGTITSNVVIGFLRGNEIYEPGSPFEITTLAVRSLIQCCVDSLSDELYENLIASYPLAARDFIATHGETAQSELAELIIKAIPTNDQQPLRQDLLELASSLAFELKDSTSVDKDLLAPLAEWMRTARNGQEAALPYSSLVALVPSLIDSTVVGKLLIDRRVAQGSGRLALDIALARLGAARSDLWDPEVLRDLRTFVDDSTTLYSPDLRLLAVQALLEVTEANRVSSAEASSIRGRLVAEVLSTEAHGWELSLKKSWLLWRILGHQGVESSAIRAAMGAADTSGLSLITIAKRADAADFLAIWDYAKQHGMLARHGKHKESYELIAARSRSRYSLVSKTNDAASIEDMIVEDLRRRDDGDSRLGAVFTALFLALENRDAGTHLIPRLQALRRTEEPPETRLAAGRSLEVIKIAELITAPKDVHRSRSRLALLGQYLDPVVSTAAEICASESWSSD